MEIVPDPTNSLDSEGKTRGNVLKHTIDGDPVQHLDWGSDLWWRALYSTWRNGVNVQTLPEPAVIQVDIIKSTELLGGILGFHRLNKKTGDSISVAAIEADRGDVLKLLARDGKGNDTRLRLKAGLFDSRKWNTIAIELRPDGTLIPWINGINAYVDPTKPLKVPVDAEHDPGFMDAHAGYQIASPQKNDGIQNGLWLMNDNFMVIKYESEVDR